MHPPPAVRLFLKVLLVWLCYIWTAQSSLAAPSADLWPHWLAKQASSTTRVNHSLWNAFLKKHVITNHPSKVFLLNYAQVDANAKKTLNQYLKQLQGVKVTRLTRNEQLPYWINLYNAKTVALILEYYPVTSIRKIKFGFFSGGPWSKKLLKVEGQALSLNDIEHRILRPIWKDPRLHYAVNCASIGCPNLMPIAFNTKNTQTLLAKSAKAYVNHPRGVRFAQQGKGKLVVSSIYHWFIADFGGDLKGVLAHLQQHANPTLKQRLANYTQDDYDHAYDWALNTP